MDAERDDIAHWFEEGRDLLSLVQEQMEYLAQENERLRAELGPWMSSRR